jgi:copper chaperone CopZ
MALETLHLTVQGMTCGNCARSVERKLAATAGVTKATVDLSGAAATVEYDPAQVGPVKLADAVRQLGYQVPA